MNAAQFRHSVAPILGISKQPSDEMVHPVLFLPTLIGANFAHELTNNSGFVTILDKHDRVISNPGGTKPEYRNGKLEIMVQEQPIFNHCHDVCIDNDKNIYVCQWNANKTYPVKLERV